MSLQKRNKKLEVNDHYIKVQEGLLGCGFLAVMTGKAVKVYVALCKFKDWKTGNCWPSNTLLCEVTGLCKPSVIKGSQELEELGLIKTWRNKKKGKRFFKKFYHVKSLGDINPMPLDKYSRPMTMAKYPYKKDEKGRFTKSKSNSNGLSESNGNGITKANGIGKGLISLNKSDITNNKVSFFKDDVSKETIRELIELRGKVWVQNYLKKIGRNPKLG